MASWKDAKKKIKKWATPLFGPEYRQVNNKKKIKKYPIISKETDPLV